ncbi:TetR/AcrR family transcriptional regulator [Micromonospora sp. WMMD987]|uniref:TetR/AcrR family transcriptional regulator n=1 Tax=Micromonospora sp. WMMD987 TaxID=3016089 RepID=UPI00249A5132|nr:TetR/AcrR family transcriptional regulator [Micromonospora sp. WMMD987]WFE92834.1 TetR/AcrR family transcriptional regulator [Micromonospora sp. WMMD987]
MTVAPQPPPRDDVRSDIVRAATRLLREHGADAVTTRAVAQTAGVQAPTIYRLFGDKNGLVDAVAEEVLAAYVASKADTEPGDPVADLRAGWHRHVEFGLTNPELFRLLGTRRPGDPSPATVAGVDVLRSRVRRLAAAGLLRVDEQRATTLIHAAGTGVILALLETSAPRRDPGLAEAMLDAVLGGILTATPVTSEPTVAAAAVTFAAAAPDLPGLTDAERALLTEWIHRSLTLLRGPHG